MEDNFTFIIGGIEEFSHTEIEVKGEKKYYVTGYISTKDLDLVNDIVTPEALEDMAEQLNTGNIKLDIDHEAWRKGENGPNMLPIGRIVEAKFDAEQGRLWVKALINNNSSRFKNAWSNIKDKFIDAFSIAFKPIQIATKIINGKEIRLLEKILLLNVALTGNPANPEAKITNVFAKSRDYMESKIMADEKKIIQEEKIVVEPVVVEPVVTDFKALLEETTKKFSDELKTLKESIEGRDAELKDLKKQLEAPIFKSVEETAPEEPAPIKEEVEAKSPFQMIQ